MLADSAGNSRSDYSKKGASGGRRPIRKRVNQRSFILSHNEHKAAGHQGSYAI